MTDATRDLLEQHFDTAFAAPDGIKKLRELILTLAMQGKLVEQDPTDQPASELLKEIDAEKQRLVKAGKIKAPKPLPPIKPEEVPYQLPQGWEWVRLGEIGIINPRNDADDLAKAGFVPMPMIPEGYSEKHQFEERSWSEIKKGYTHFADGDIGMAKITPCFENGKSCVFSGLPNGIGAGTTELHIFRNSFNSVEPRFLLWYLKNPHYISKAVPKMTGSAGQKRVPTPYFTEQPFPLPPLSEQHRIVARIEQLMARCDVLETLRKEREEKRQAVHAAAIQQLLSAPSGSAWDFIQQHFGALYTVKENVAELRKAILQLAVMGRLVPQDPEDPPTSELLKEIDSEKQRLVKEKIIKSPKPVSSISQGGEPFQVPENWRWVRIAELAESIDYGTSQKTCDDSSLIPVYRMGNIVDGQLIDEGFKYIAPDIDELPYLFLKPNDILFNRTNSYELVGKSARYTGSANQATFASYLIRIRLFDALLNPTFISQAMNAPYFRSTQIEPEIVQQCGQANFNGTKLSLCLIPLPPLPEQHRIVARIEQLMALCDTLDQKINDATDKQTELLRAVMAQV